MLGIYPRKYCRKLKEAYQLWHFKKQARACGVQVEIGEGVRLKHCMISCESLAKQGAKTTLLIGNNCYLKYAMFGFFGTNNRIEIGDGTEVNARGKGRETYMLCGENPEIIVGRDSLFSHSIVMSTTDFHLVYNTKGEVINNNKSISIGNHVWIGRSANICKGVALGNNIVVGTGSVVTKSYMQNGCIIAGNPAVIKKENIDWSI